MEVRDFLKRVLSTYLLANIVVGLLLTIVNQCPWLSDFDVALKRAFIGISSLDERNSDGFYQLVLI